MAENARSRYNLSVHAIEHFCKRRRGDAMPAFNLRDLGILICLTARVIDKKL